MSTFKQTTIHRLFLKAQRLQMGLRRIPVDDKLNALGEVGRLWASENYPRRRKLLRELPHTSGYRKETIAFELGDLPAYLDPDNLGEVLDAPGCFPAGRKMLDGYCEVRRGEFLTANPAGPHLVVGCGNTLLPPLLSLLYALLTNNVVAVRAAAANHIALNEILASFADAAKNTVSATLRIALQQMQRCAIVFHLPHDAREYRELVENAPYRMLHYWGGGWALDVVRNWVVRNPHHPGLLINGPLTGVAVVDGAFMAASQDRQRLISELAFNMAVFEQKLCNSPTEAYFVGRYHAALAFAADLGLDLERYDKEYPHDISASIRLKTQLVRNLLRRGGAHLVMPADGGANWTIVVSKDDSTVDSVSASELAMSIYKRTKFVEIIVVKNLNRVCNLVASLPGRNCHRGITGVSTVGYAMRENQAFKMAAELGETGVYRFVPLPQVYARSSLEPSDGRYIPREFTYLSYLAAPRSENAVFWSQVRGRRSRG